MSDSTEGKLELSPNKSGSKQFDISWNPKANKTENSEKY